ncbi:MAG: hydrogenase maturation nickel metallochaperone HypA [Phycisphaerae bacterium]
MHEAGIAQGILDAAMAVLPAGKVRITRLVVSAGVLSGVEEECLSMYLGELSRGTPAAGATLELKVARARLVCRECANSVEYDGSGPVQVACAKCGGNNGLEGGRDEIILESVEVVKDDPD